MCRVVFAGSRVSKRVGLDRAPFALIAGLLALAPSASVAGVPPLLPVETGSALVLSAPAGWGVSVEPPQDEHMSLIASLSPDCGVDGMDVNVYIQVARSFATPRDLLEDQKPDLKPTRRHGWLCIEDGSEALCAGTLRGLKGVVSVSFGLEVSPRGYRFFGGVEFAARLAAALRWKGGEPEALPRWSREPGPNARTRCPFAGDPPK